MDLSSLKKMWVSKFQLHLLDFECNKVIFAHCSSAWAFKTWLKGMKFSQHFQIKNQVFINS